jgi:nitroreductase/NAD-dependent dihydropyrimidine dehydrogenase PreA subunit
MSLFTIDSDKCDKCGICAAECPMGLITLQEGSIPTPIDVAEEQCINCGHCLAVCPSAALSLEKMPLPQCPSPDKSLLPSSEQFTEMVRTRRSIRAYKNKKVDRDELAKIIDTAHYAPTGKNTQLVNWLVYNDAEVVKELAGLCIDWMRDEVSKNTSLAAVFDMPKLVQAWDSGYDPILRGAPALVITHVPKEYLGATDCTIALTTLELAAFANGLGTCWAGYFQFAYSKWPALQEALNIPEGNISYGSMMVGYPKFSYNKLPLRNPTTITWG